MRVYACVCICECVSVWKQLRARRLWALGLLSPRCRRTPNLLLWKSASQSGLCGQSQTPLRNSLPFPHHSIVPKSQSLYWASNALVIGALTASHCMLYGSQLPDAPNSGHEHPTVKQLHVVSSLRAPFRVRGHCLKHRGLARNSWTMPPQGTTTYCDRPFNMNHWGPQQSAVTRRPLWSTIALACCVVTLSPIPYNAKAQLSALLIPCFHPTPSMTRHSLTISCSSQVASRVHIADHSPQALWSIKLPSPT